MVIFQFVMVNYQRVEQTMRNLQGGSRALNLGFMDVYSRSMLERGESKLTNVSRGGPPCIYLVMIKYNSV